MTELSEVVEDYLAMRRSLGFKLTHYGRLLGDFVAYLDDTGATTVTTDAAVAWATQPRDATPRWWSQRLGVVRGFAAHLHAFDPTAEVPPAELLACAGHRAELTCTPMPRSQLSWPRLALWPLRSVVPPTRPSSG
jgi:integrase/recombinase XerD